MKKTTEKAVGEEGPAVTASDSLADLVKGILACLRPG